MSVTPLKRSRLLSYSDIGYAPNNSDSICYYAVELMNGDAISRLMLRYVYLCVVELRLNEFGQKTHACC